MATLEEIRRMMAEEKPADEPLQTTPGGPAPADAFEAAPAVSTTAALSENELAQQAIWKNCRYVVVEESPAGEAIDIILRFGKYKGQTLTEISSAPGGRNYLLWVLNNSSRHVEMWREGRNVIRRKLGVGGQE